MEWIFGAILAVTIIHMGEEYVYPGGFTDVMKRLNPKFAPLMTAPTIVIINGLQVLLCIVAMAVGKNALAFSMSVAALLFINGLMHILGCVRVKGYAPGVITGVLLYIPLSTYAYYVFISSSQLTPGGAVAAGVLGLLYQAVPISYFILASTMRKRLHRAS